MPAPDNPAGRPKAGLLPTLAVSDEPGPQAPVVTGTPATPKLEILDGKHHPERMAMMTLPEFLRHTANRRPQPLTVMAAVLSAWASVQQEVTKRDAGKWRIFPLRRADYPEEEAWVSLDPSPSALTVRVACEMMQELNDKARRECLLVASVTLSTRSV